MHHPKYDVTVLLCAVRSIQVFDPFLIGKYQHRCSKTDAMLPEVNFVLPVILFYRMARNRSFHTKSIM